MHKVQCNDCQGWFSRKDVLMRYQRNVHGEVAKPQPSTVAETLPPPLPHESMPPPHPPSSSQQLPKYTLSPPTSKQRQEDFVFKRPFTTYISGPTCGKTYFCKMLSQHCLKMIWPPPERIMWLFKHWQPLYDVIQSTVYPKVEFI